MFESINNNKSLEDFLNNNNMIFWQTNLLKIKEIYNLFDFDGNNIINKDDIKYLIENPKDFWIYIRIAKIMAWLYFLISEKVWKDTYKEKIYELIVIIIMYPIMKIDHNKEDAIKLGEQFYWVIKGCSKISIAIDNIFKYFAQNKFCNLFCICKSNEDKITTEELVEDQTYKLKKEIELKNYKKINLN